jgi:pyrimidine operon attenuation protein/uracil phosphoribosyltransferase
MMKIIIELDTFDRTIRRMAHEILEQHPKLHDVILVGILGKGYRLAGLLQQIIKEIGEVDLLTHGLEIRPFRDDEKVNRDVPRSSFIVDKKTIILIDDVLFTGRSVRAAIDALMSLGRPQLIKLAVLVDRGHRQLPIRPDYIGKNIPTNYFDRVEVNFDQRQIIIK